MTLYKGSSVFSRQKKGEKRTCTDADIIAEKSSEPSEEHSTCRITDCAWKNRENDLGDLEQNQHQRTENSKPGNIASDTLQRAESAVRDSFYNPTDQKDEQYDNRITGEFLKKAVA